MIEQFIPFAGMLTGLIIVPSIMWMIVHVTKNDRIKAERGRHVQELDEEIQELRVLVADLSDELSETQERLDFAERLLLQEGRGPLPLSPEATEENISGGH